MEKKLAVIVDNKKVTTEAENIELCSSACDVAMETCSSQSHDTCGDSVLTLEEMPILSGFVVYFEGNISTKIGLKICACIEKLNMGVVKIDLLA